MELREREKRTERVGGSGGKKIIVTSMHGVRHFNSPSIMLTLHSGHRLALLAQFSHSVEWPHGSNLTVIGSSHRKQSSGASMIDIQKYLSVGYLDHTPYACAQEQYYYYNQKGGQSHTYQQHNL